MRFLIVILIATVLTSCQEDTPIKSAKPLKEYTESEPGIWDGLEDSHLPIVKEKEQKGKRIITIVVPLGSKNKKHYIEKIGLLEAGKVVSVRNYAPGKVQNRVRAKFIIENESPDKVFAKCSQHDLWTKEL